MQEELNVQHSTPNVQRRIEEILNTEEMMNAEKAEHRRCNVEKNGNE